MFGFLRACSIFNAVCWTFPVQFVLLMRTANKDELGKVQGKNRNGKPMSRMIRAIAIPTEQTAPRSPLAPLSSFGLSRKDARNNSLLARGMSQAKRIKYAAQVEARKTFSHTEGARRGLGSAAAAAEKFSLSVWRQPAELGSNALMCKNAIVLDLVVNKALKRRQKNSSFLFPLPPNSRKSRWERWKALAGVGHFPPFPLSKSEEKTKRKPVTSTANKCKRLVKLWDLVSTLEGVHKRIKEEEKTILNENRTLCKLWKYSLK